MSIVDKFKNFVGIPEDDYYEDDEEMDFVTPNKAPEYTAPAAVSYTHLFCRLS